MSNKHKYTYFCGDFETTVYDGQESTEVWSSAIVELYTDNVIVHHSISDTFNYFKKLKKNVICYYHNLKFDGSFWLSYLLDELHFKQAYHESDNVIEWVDDKFMLNNSFKYVISDMGQWYEIKIRTGGHFIIFRDSLKLLPFSLKEIGKAFKTTHQKLEMEYKGFRYSGCTITEEEMDYIKNDVLVMKEAIEIMFNNGHNKTTIGSCCLSEFKNTFFSKDQYDAIFPDLTTIEINKELYGAETVDKYIRKSYKGGWTYLCKGKENKIYKKGVTADVNSLYPSMMSSESGNKYPIGLPTFWKGNIPDEALKADKYYFVRIRTKFYLKEGYLPFIQIKGNPLYKSTEALETSDIYDKNTDQYYDKYYDGNGNLRDTSLILTLTMTDYELIKKHYELVDFEILDGCYFKSAIGIFDEYIEKYKKQKLESTGALRTLAKLFLNNLYGKLAASTESSFKVAYLKDDHSIAFTTQTEFNKKAGYIPCGSAITSYARCFTITAAQINYHGKDKRGFIYADTDSIHCDLEPEELKGIKVHDKDFCCWKLESTWDKAIFVRQKTYIEHIIAEDLKVIEKSYYNVKCAGMPERSKNMFLLSMGEDLYEKVGKLNEVEEEYIKEKRSLSDFKVGLKVPSKLMPKRIKGGTILLETWYEIR